MTDANTQLSTSPLTIGGQTLSSRLVVGTGKYADYETMHSAIEASGADCVTVAVRRERLMDSEGRSLLEFIDTDRITILPNTAGCFTAEDAVRVSRLGRELLEQIDNPGKNWVKLEVLGDKRTLLPDPVGTLEACRELVADGFQVLCYASDDPRLAVALRDAGAATEHASHPLRPREIPEVPGATRIQHERQHLRVPPCESNNRINSILRWRRLSLG